MQTIEIRRYQWRFAIFVKIYIFLCCKGIHALNFHFFWGSGAFLHLFFRMLKRADYKALDVHGRDCLLLHTIYENGKPIKRTMGFVADSFQSDADMG